MQVYKVSDPYRPQSQQVKANAMTYMEIAIAFNLNFALQNNCQILSLDFGKYLANSSSMVDSL